MRLPCDEIGNKADNLFVHMTIQEQHRMIDCVVIFTVLLRVWAGSVQTLIKQQNLPNLSPERNDKQCQAGQSGKNSIKTAGTLFRVTLKHGTFTGNSVQVYNIMVEL